MTLSPHEREKISSVFSGACHQATICPIKDILARFGDKWSMYALLLLGQNRIMRFGELRAAISGISQRMLTVTLRSLEEDGIVARKHYPQIPPRVEYELTQLGESLLGQLLNLATWAGEHSSEIVKARKQYIKQAEEN
jgi:DNA-binding HxlR family transcriptional regulator